MYKHAKVSTVPDGSDATQIRSSDWNAALVGNPDAVWVKTSTTTLASWTTAATLIGAVGTGVGTLTVPANAMTAGTTIRIKARGVLGTTSTAPTLTINVTLGGVAVCWTNATSLTTASMSSRPWELEVELTCRQTGSTATVIGSIMFTWSNSATLFSAMGNAANANVAANVNTATANAIDVTATCGTSHANNTISCIHATVERLN